MIGGFDVAVSELLTPTSIAIVLVGLVVGTAAAILPGVSPLTMMALALPFTFTMERDQAFMLLVALMASAGFAGSMTSILINVPGDGINAATCLDGYPLAQRGKAGVAIGASAMASGLGGIFGTLVLILTLPVIGGVILAFAPAEFFALAILGVSLIASVSTRSPLKGLIAGMIGMLFGLIGDNQIVGGTRYMFGVLELADGIPLVPALIGLFALPELFDLMRANQTVSAEHATASGSVREGALETLRRPGLVLRSSFLGTLMGLMPGVGQSIASWVSYYAAMNTSKHPETFGKGNIEGVIAPEATIDAKEAASMLPVLVFGLPAGVTTAVLLSAFQIHGVVPGQRLLANDGALVWVMILTMTFSSFSTSILGFLFANSMVKITLVPVALLAPVIMAIGLVGSYAEQGSLFGVVLLVVFGLLGVAMTRYDFPRAPLLVGMILVPLAETNFYQAQQLSRGSYEFLLRPITVAVLALTTAAVLFPIARRWWSHRRGTVGRALQVAGVAEEGVPRSSFGELAFTLFVVAITAVFFVDTIALDPKVRLFPIAITVPMCVLTLVLLWRAIRFLPPRAVSAIAFGPEMRRSALVLGWLLLLPMLVLVGGVLLATPLYIGLVGLAFAPREFSVRRAVVTVCTAAGVAGLVYFVFQEALGVPFYPGLFG